MPLKILYFTKIAPFFKNRLTTYLKYKGQLNKRFLGQWPWPALGQGWVLIIKIKIFTLYVRMNTPKNFTSEFLLSYTWGLYSNVKVVFRAKHDKICIWILLNLNLGSEYLTFWVFLHNLQFVQLHISFILLHIIRVCQLFNFFVKILKFCIGSLFEIINLSITEICIHDRAH